MGDNDSFRLIDHDEAVALGCFLIAIAAVTFAVDEKPQPVAREAVVQHCPGQQWVRQCGPVECWHQQPPAPVCINATLGELAPHLLTHPLESK